MSCCATGKGPFEVSSKELTCALILWGKIEQFPGKLSLHCISFIKVSSNTHNRQCTPHSIPHSVSQHPWLHPSQHLWLHPSQQPCLHPSQQPVTASLTAFSQHPCLHPSQHPFLNTCLHPPQHPSYHPWMHCMTLLTVLGEAAAVHTLALVACGCLIKHPREAVPPLCLLHHV